MTLKLNFYKLSNCNLWCCLDTSMTFSLFGFMAEIEKFLDDLNSFDNNIKFAHESSRDNDIFLDLIAKLSKGRFNY